MKFWICFTHISGVSVLCLLSLLVLMKKNLLWIRLPHLHMADAVLSFDSPCQFCLCATYIFLVLQGHRTSVVSLSMKWMVNYLLVWNHQVMCDLLQPKYMDSSLKQHTLFGKFSSIINDGSTQFFFSSMLQVPTFLS